ncbi:MAG: tetratricopeptide repeat protein [Alphaproteobacteria bacterium]|nr:tetratricopeptide repeat protein [Alphaproteobacteria bacterium]
MLKRFLVVLGLLAIVSSYAAPAYAVEGVSERQARKKLEAQKYPQQASEALQNNNPDLAIELFTKAIESKAFNDQPQTIGELYYGRGNAYRMKKDCAAAIVDYNKAVETLTDGDLYFTRAACYLELKEDDKALADLDAAVKVDPDAAMFRNARCILLFNRKDFAGALPDCEKASAASPNDKNLLTAISQAAEQTGNKARAADAYRKLLALDPGNPIATEGLKRVGG